MPVYVGRQQRGTDKQNNRRILKGEWRMEKNRPSSENHQPDRRDHYMEYAEVKFQRYLRSKKQFLIQTILHFRHSIPQEGKIEEEEKRRTKTSQPNIIGN